MAASTRPSDVSRYLSNHCFRRSESRPSRIRGYSTSTSGFRVSGYDGRTFVEYVLGHGAVYMPQDRRIKLIREELYKIEDRLGDRYSVVRLFPEPGEKGEHFRLEIKPKDD